MKKNKLGKKGPEISSVGFGAWAIGGSYKYGWGPSNDDEAIRALIVANENGINWVDTAPIYGYGHSEIVVGRAVKQCPNEMLIATKCGLLHDDKDNLSKNLSAKSIELEVDKSLKRLGVDQIDLYQCHWPDINTALEETCDCLARLVRKGKVRYIGVSNFSITELQYVSNYINVTSIQSPYNLLRREIESEIIPYCVDNEIGLLAYSPMQSGLLTGKFDFNVLSKDDWRRRKDQWFLEPILGKHLYFVDRLRGIADEKGISVGQLAIAWVNSHKGITSAIVGARNEKQVLENAKAMEIYLDKEIQNYINAIIDECYKQ